MISFQFSECAMRKNSGWLMKLLYSFSILHAGLRMYLLHSYVKGSKALISFFIEEKGKSFSSLYIIHSRKWKRKGKRTSLWSGNVYKDSIDGRTSDRRVGLGFIIYKYTRGVSSVGIVNGKDTGIPHSRVKRWVIFHPFDRKSENCAFFSSSSSSSSSSYSKFNI